MHTETLLTTEEVARRKGVKPRTVRTWIKHGLPYKKSGWHYRFRWEDVEQWNDSIDPKKQKKVGRGARQRKRDTAEDEAALVRAGLRYD